MTAVLRQIDLAFWGIGLPVAVFSFIIIGLIHKVMFRRKK